VNWVNLIESDASIMLNYIDPTDFSFSSLHYLISFDQLVSGHTICYAAVIATLAHTFERPPANSSRSRRPTSSESTRRYDVRFFSLVRAPIDAITISGMRERCVTGVEGSCRAELCSWIQYSSGYTTRCTT
jgi:hypothetical protein